MTQAGSAGWPERTTVARPEPDQPRATRPSDSAPTRASGTRSAGSPQPSACRKSRPVSAWCRFLGMGAEGSAPGPTIGASAAADIPMSSLSQLWISLACRPRGQPRKPICRAPSPTRTARTSPFVRVETVHRPLSVSNSAISSPALETSGKSPRVEMQRTARAAQVSTAKRLVACDPAPPPGPPPGGTAGHFHGQVEGFAGRFASSMPGATLRRRLGLNE